MVKTRDVFGMSPSVNSSANGRRSIVHRWYHLVSWQMQDQMPAEFLRCRRIQIQEVGPPDAYTEILLKLSCGRRKRRWMNKGGNIRAMNIPGGEPYRRAQILRHVRSVVLGLSTADSDYTFSWRNRRAACRIMGTQSTSSKTSSLFPSSEISYECSHLTAQSPTHPRFI